jgi:hypothetical protein
MSSSTATLSSERVPRDRAGLALLAGVLCIPGSTIAWDLPAGGYWIGMPLAGIAIVLGLLSWPHVTGGRRVMAAAAILLGVAAVLFTVGYLLFA